MTNKHFQVCLLTAALLFLFGGAAYSAAPAAGPALPAVSKTVLSNGLKLLVYENHGAPLVSFGLFVRAGGMDNISGQTGLAHLFEHLAFKGTERVGTTNYAAEKKLLDEMDRLTLLLPFQSTETAAKTAANIARLEAEAARYVVPNEYSKIYAGLGGGDLNAYTSADLTAYTVSLPANQVKNWMIMEADRISRPVLREFYKERAVVLEELRMGNSSPDSLLFKALLNESFSASPYRVPVIGYESDVENLTRPQALAYFREHYGPDSTTIVIAGDVNTNAVIKLVKKYFGPLPATRRAPANITAEPSRNGERRAAVRFDSQPVVYISYGIPSPRSADAPALILINELLGSGRTSRLYKNLIEGRQLALYAGAEAHLPGLREDSVQLFYAAPKAPHTAAEAEAAIYNELQALATVPVPQAELDKTLAMYEAALVMKLDKNSSMVQNLGYAECTLGDWALDWKTLAALRAVTPQDIMTAAAKYFTRDNRAVVWLEPAAEAVPAKEPAQ